MVRHKPENYNNTLKFQQNTYWRECGYILKTSSGTHSLLLTFDVCPDTMLFRLLSMNVLLALKYAFIFAVVQTCFVTVASVISNFSACSCLYNHGKGGTVQLLDLIP